MFKIHTIDDGAMPPLENLKANAATAYEVGMILAVNASGEAVKGGADSTGAQTYLCAGVLPAGSAGKFVPAYRLKDTMVLEAPFTVAATSVQLGQRLTLSADGLGLTATVTNGVAEVVGINGTAVGDTALVRLKQ